MSEQTFENLTDEQKDIIFNDEKNKDLFIKMTFGTNLSGPFKTKIDKDWTERNIIINGNVLKMIIKQNQEKFDELNSKDIIDEIEIGKWYYI